ncbi:MAG: hypothetical protein GY846_17285 [Deltaproteobacteria bacterium]|nr:hypothetical protein [Deltaproteobacteria bacterium]
MNGLELKVDAAKRLITEAMIKKRVESGELTHEELDQVSGGQELCYHNCMAVFNDEIVCTATCMA